MFIKLPEYVENVLQKLEKSGFEAYVVGGCVRDILMGKKPNDYDITTNALPSDIQFLFEKTVPTGIKHGTITVISEGLPIEVTTFRVENEYKDSRRPESVNFVSDLKEDLSRRDFTVNAIAYNYSSGIVDIFGGMNDIKNKILRTVGEPKKRFSEDALRILRLFRFASQLEFTPHDETLKFALMLSYTLKKISCERIATELEKAVCGKNPNALLPLINCGGLKFLGIKNANDLNSIKKLPPNTETRLAAFVLSTNTDAQYISEKLKTSNSLRDYICAMERLSKTPFESTKSEIKKLLRIYSPKLLLDFAHIKSAIQENDTKKITDAIDEIIKMQEPYLISHLDIDGHTLQSLGYKGTEIRNVLEFLLNEVIKNPNLNKQIELLNLIKIYRN